MTETTAIVLATLDYYENRLKDADTRERTLRMAFRQAGLRLNSDPRAVEWAERELNSIVRGAVEADSQFHEVLYPRNAA